MHHAIATILCSLVFGTVALSAAPATLTFKKSSVDTTVEPEAASTSIEFPFENKSGETIEIVKHASPCGCISTGFKDDRLIYPPGAKGNVTVNFKVSNFYGTVQKKIMVWMKEGPEGKRPPITLTANITIPELITVTPRTLNWKTGESNAPKSYKIEVNHEKTIHITSLSCTNNNFVTELKTLRDGMEYELTVTPRDVSGASFGIIKIFTDSKVSRYRLIQAFTNIRQDASGK